MEHRNRHNTNHLNAPSKHFNNKGKWVPKLIQTEILVCRCGNKYIKTRTDQVICVRCINAARTE